MSSKFSLNYKEESSDIKLLTKIHLKSKANFWLNEFELSFIHERKFQGFGYKKNLTINEILASEDENVKRTGLSCIFECNPNQISLNNDEAISGNIIYHWGDLDLRELELFEGNLPKYVCGEVYLNNLKSLQGNFPEYVGGHLSLESLESYEGNFPEHVGDDLWLSSLKSFKGNFPKYVLGYLYLESLQYFKGNFPEPVGRFLHLRSLKSFEGKLPEHVGDVVVLNKYIHQENKNLFIQKFGDKVVFN